MPAFLRAGDPVKIYGALQQAYMAAEAESILEDVADLGRLMAVTGIPIESVVEIHGRILSLLVDSGPLQAAPGFLNRQFEAASVCLSELIVSWRIASETLVAATLQDYGRADHRTLSSRFAGFTRDGHLEAGQEEAGLLQDLAGGVRHSQLESWTQAVLGPDHAEAIRRALSQHRIIAIEFAVPGHQACYRLVACPFRQGGVIGLSDMTAISLARDAEFQRRKLESLGQLAGGMAHEFNNQLQPIISLAQMAQEDYADDPRLAEEFTIILDAARRSAEIIRDLMIFVRHSSPDPTRLNLTEVVGQELAVLQRSLHQSVTLSFVADPAMEAAVIGNRRELGQILQNLIANAVHACDGHGRVTVTLDHCHLAGTEAARFQVAAGRYCRLSILDGGKGIPADQIGRIFEPFFTTKALGEGTGLGLPIVRGLVRSWHGGIAVLSQPGQGARFDIVLPPAPPLFGETTPDPAIPAAIAELP